MKILSGGIMKNDKLIEQKVDREGWELVPYRGIRLSFNRFTDLHKWMKRLSGEVIVIEPKKSEDNINSPVLNFTLLFEEESDAALFKLRWHGKMASHSVLNRLRKAS